MVCLAKIKCFVTSFALFYAIYLTTYKCPKQHESGLNHAVLKLVHPFSHQHDQLCEALDKGHTYVSPYLAHVHGFWSSNVESHQLYKDYKIGNKLTTVQTHYNTHVYPYVLKFWELVEVAEYRLAVYAHDLSNSVSAHFHHSVKPKVVEIHSSVAEKAETVKEQVKEQIKSRVDEL